MTNLSPAALSVWCRFCEVVEEHGPPRLGLAAALRAAADLVVPDNYHCFTRHFDWDLGMEARNDTVRENLLAIAAELESC